MRGFSYFCCPFCGEIVVSSAVPSVGCCEKELRKLLLQESGEGDGLSVRTDGDEIIVTLSHPMTKDSYISFIALETWDGVVIRKLYPEWNEALSFPGKRGRLVWAMNTGEAFYRKLR